MKTKILLLLFLPLLAFAQTGRYTDSLNGLLHEANGSIVIADEQAGAFVNSHGFRVNPDHSLIVSGAGGGGTWGSITGTLSGQTDLWTQLTTGSTSGTAANLSGTPTLPSGTTLLTPSTTYTASCTLDLAAGSGKCLGPIVRMNLTGTANTVTVPPHSSVAFAAGACVTVRQVGTGVTTIVAGSGVTITTPSSLILRTRYSSVQLCQSDTQDTWDLYGDTQ